MIVQCKLFPVESRNKRKIRNNNLYDLVEKLKQTETFTLLINCVYSEKSMSHVAQINETYENLLN